MFSAATASAGPAGPRSTYWTSPSRAGSSGPCARSPDTWYSYSGNPPGWPPCPSSSPCTRWTPEAGRTARKPGRAAGPSEPW